MKQVFAMFREAAPGPQNPKTPKPQNPMVAIIPKKRRNMLCFWCSLSARKSFLAVTNNTKESIENKMDNHYKCIDNDEHT